MLFFQKHFRDYMYLQCIDFKKKNKFYFQLFILLQTLLLRKCEMFWLLSTRKIYNGKIVGGENDLIFQKKNQR